jgi:hypothetical protein
MAQMKEAEDTLKGYVMRTNTVRWYNWAAAHLSLGHNGEAISDLEHAYEDRLYEIMFAGVDPMLDQLRKEPRFRALLVRMKLNSLNK